MRGIIYARYSSDSQREESVERLIRECKEYAKYNGITIIGTYIDRFCIVFCRFYGFFARFLHLKIFLTNQHIHVITSASSFRKEGGVMLSINSNAINKLYPRCNNRHGVI